MEEVWPHHRVLQATRLTAGSRNGDECCALALQAVRTCLPVGLLKAWFRKVEQLKRVSVLVDLFAVQPIHSQNHVWLRNVVK